MVDGSIDPTTRERALFELDSTAGVSTADALLTEIAPGAGGCDCDVTFGGLVFDGETYDSPLPREIVGNETPEDPDDEEPVSTLVRPDPPDTPPPPPPPEDVEPDEPEEPDELEEPEEVLGIACASARAGTANPTATTNEPT